MAFNAATLAPITARPLILHGAAIALPPISDTLNWDDPERPRVITLRDAAYATRRAILPRPD